MAVVVPDAIEIEIGPQRLKALRGIPRMLKGPVIFAHGSDSYATRWFRHYLAG
jgi:hypothetical protein